MHSGWIPGPEGRLQHKSLTQPEVVTVFLTKIMCKRCLVVRWSTSRCHIHLDECSTPLCNGYIHVYGNLTHHCDILSGFGEVTVHLSVSEVCLQVCNMQAAFSNMRSFPVILTRYTLQNKQVSMWEPDRQSAGLRHHSGWKGEYSGNASLSCPHRFTHQNHPGSGLSPFQWRVPGNFWFVKQSENREEPRI